MNAHGNRRRTEALTANLLDKPKQNHPIGDVIESQKQGEADPNSLISVPNRPRSDGENGYHKR